MLSAKGHGLVNQTWRTGSRKVKYRRLLKRRKSQQPYTLGVPILVYLGNYLLNSLYGNCIELTEALRLQRPFWTLFTGLIITARHRYKPEALLSPIEGSL